MRQISTDIGTRYTLEADFRYYMLPYRDLARRMRLHKLAGAKLDKMQKGLMRAHNTKYYSLVDRTMSVHIFLGLNLRTVIE